MNLIINEQINIITMEEIEIKCTKCPECGCIEYTNEDELGEGFRMCKDCSQEWWIDIDYDS